MRITLTLDEKITWILMNKKAAPCDAADMRGLFD